MVGSDPEPTATMPSQSQQQQQQQQRQRPTEEAGLNNAKEDARVWATPFVVAFVFFFVFLLFWMYYAILQRYWIKGNWNDSLPGLDTTPWHKFSMRMHMTTGAFGMLLGPFQFIPYIRKRCRVVHRWSGRLYCVCGILACIFGLWFIYLKGPLVGGWNMSAAFAVAGIAIGVLSYQTWKSARAAKFGTLARHNFQAHRNWGIRSYSQMIAPALYRYWYIFMEIFHLYRTPIPLRNGGYCDENNFCPDYARWWDAAYCWVYWVSAWIVAEIIIYFLPDIGPKEQQMLVAPLLEGSSDGGDVNESITTPLISDTDDGAGAGGANNGASSTQATASASYGSEGAGIGTAGGSAGDVGANSYTSPITSAPLSTHSSAKVVNMVGTLLALATIIITAGTFYLVFTQ